MKTFLTPAALTLEIRNATGDIQIRLTDTSTTTVDLSAGTKHPLGFLDDILNNFGAGSRAFDLLGRGRQSGTRGGASSAAAGGVDQSDDQAPADITDLVRVEHQEGANPTLIVDTDPARDGWRSSFGITITAPTGSNIRVQSQSADVKVSGPTGLVDVRTASGDIQLDEARGKVLAQTASGDVSIAHAGGDVDVRTASGNVGIGPVAGDAVVHTTSGDIRVGSVGGSIGARSVSGDIRVADATAGQAQVDAVSGDVEIGVHAGSLASIDLSTVSGNTDTDFEVTDGIPAGDSPILKIVVKTTSGHIRLHRAA